MAFSITYASITSTLEARGIDRAVVSDLNLAVSEFTFSYPIATGDYSAPAYAYGGALTLLEDSTPIFIGTVTSVRRHIERGSWRVHVVVSNAWWQLARTIYQQLYTRRSGDFLTLVGGYSTRVILGQDDWGRKITLAAEIQSIVTYANMVGSGVVSSVSIPTLPLSWFEEARDITCEDALRRCLGVVPDTAGYFEYGSGVPVLVFKRRAYMSSVDIDLADENVDLISDIEPRNDLLVAGVVFTFITEEEATGTGDEAIDGVSWQRETRQTAGATAGPGVVVATIQLAAQGTAQAETPPTGLAAEYYASRNVLHWQGRIRLVGQTAPAGAGVGTVLNILNGQTEWATMNAVVQERIRDLIAGTTEIVFGPPEHLGPQDFVGIMTTFRERKQPSDFLEKRHNGTEGYGDPEDEENPGVAPADDVDPEEQAPNDDGGKPVVPAVMPTIDITFCSPTGVTKTARVVGTLISGGTGGGGPPPGP